MKDQPSRSRTRRPGPWRIAEPTKGAPSRWRIRPGGRGGVPGQEPNGWLGCLTAIVLPIAWFLFLYLYWRKLPLSTFAMGQVLFLGTGFVGLVVSYCMAKRKLRGWQALASAAMLNIIAALLQWWFRLLR